jgi:sialate O-acetylesterase
MRFIAAILCTVFFPCAYAIAEVHPACLFADHMILQESATVPVWGTADPGESVAVTLAQKTALIRADSAGRWRVDLNLSGLAGGPYVLTLRGKNLVTISDVLVGEVWLAGGQSNMEFALAGSTNAAQEIAQSTDPLLRQFEVEKAGSLTPLDTCSGRWVAAAPDTSGRFTAIGYYFAKKLRQELHHPVGLVSSYYGGSNVESWLSPNQIQNLPEIEAPAQAMIDEGKSYTDRLAKFRQDYRQWQANYHREDTDPGDTSTHAVPDTSQNGWHAVNIGGSYTESSLPNGGILWLRKSVQVAPGQAGIYLPIHIGAPADFDEAYWNGVLFGSTTASASTSMNDGPRSSLIRRYDVPANLVKAGEATLAVRIFNPAAPPSINGQPRGMMQGAWMAMDGVSLPTLDSTAIAAYPHLPLVPTNERSMPTSLFNAMIHPLVPYAIRGVIWMQGEANTGRAFQYRTVFPAMIQEWRRQWGEGDFPFYLCQLANWGARPAQPTESNIAELREAQSMALALPLTGEALTIDVGEADDVHFRDKQTVGLRLAAIALNQTYARAVPYSGPVYTSSERENGAIRIHFKFTDGGLSAHPVTATYKLRSTYADSIPLVRNSPLSQLEGFQICASDRKWVWANAIISGDTVVVSSPEVPAPIAVRYGWANNPIVNLYNGAGFPADPFRTDDFPGATRDAKF